MRVRVRMRMSRPQLDLGWKIDYSKVNASSGGGVFRSYVVEFGTQLHGLDMCVCFGSGRGRGAASIR